MRADPRFVTNLDQAQNLYRARSAQLIFELTPQLAEVGPSGLRPAAVREPTRLVTAVITSKPEFAG